jgi:multiple sugar transport system substrate-binding protein
MMRRRELGALASGLGLSMLGGLKAARAEDDSAQFKATSGEAVYFRGWQFATDVVEGNVKRYNTVESGHVDYATVTGDYPSLMEQSLIAKAPLDVFYANLYAAVRYLEGGWLMPADTLDIRDEVVADLLPQFKEAWTYNGKLLGLSYYASTRGAIHTNLLAYNQAGFTDKDFPKDWDELYDQLYALHAKGVAQPFLPMWYNEYYGISWAFIMEVLNRGNSIADPDTHKPTLTTDATGAAYRTLTAWKKLWKSKLVPEEVLTYTDANTMDAFASGRYVFSPQQIYDVATFNQPGRSKIAGHVTILPYVKQSWGIVDSALYVMSNRKRSAELTGDVKKFASWYGYKDNTGQIAIAENWMQQDMLFSGYKSIMDSPETAARISKAVIRPGDAQVLLDVYKATPFPNGVWKVVWADEFNSYLKDSLADFLLKDGDVVGTINGMIQQINDLNDKYGL